MGGSFNPIHHRHLQIAAHALREMKLDRILFVPNGNPPHKNNDLIDAGHRFEMTWLATIQNNKFAASDIEMVRNGIIYSVDTLRLLHESFPDTEFYFIIGEDSLFNLLTWHHPLELFQQCSFIVCKRFRTALDDHPFVLDLQHKGAKFHFLSLDPININATDIRSQIHNQIFDNHQMPVEVCEYIRIMNLYGSSASPNGAMAAYPILKERLTDRRLVHSLSAAYTAHQLAEIHHIDPAKCEYAALIHDCAKCISLNELQEIVRNSSLNISDAEYQSVALLHGPVGALIARSQFGVSDSEVLTAVATHTTGYVGMTEFDMIIFLSDKIETYRRDFQKLDHIRKLARTDLYKATYEMLLASREHVQGKDAILHPNTDDVIQWIQQQINRKERFTE